jgi:hypothetical protein
MEIAAPRFIVLNGDNRGVSNKISAALGGRGMFVPREFDPVPAKIVARPRETLHEFRPSNSFSRASHPATALCSRRSERNGASVEGTRLFCFLQHLDFVHQTVHARSQRLIGCVCRHIDSGHIIEFVGIARSARSQPGPPGRSERSTKAQTNKQPGGPRSWEGSFTRHPLHHAPAKITVAQTDQPSRGYSRPPPPTWSA